MRHTPGPWKIRDWNGDEWNGDDKPSLVEGNLAFEDDGKWYGEWVCKFGEMVEEAQERQRGNARLIAAAPDLLEACKYAIENHFNVVTFGKIERAIAKAEGK